MAGRRWGVGGLSGREFLLRFRFFFRYPKAIVLPREQDCETLDAVIEVRRPEIYSIGCTTFILIHLLSRAYPSSPQAHPPRALQSRGL